MLNVRFRLISITVAFVFLSSIIGLGYIASQSDFASILLFYVLGFGAFALAWNSVREKDLNFYLGLGILARFLLVFAFPQLSDDIYRFIWDGRLIVHGYNPFDHLPLTIMEEGWASPWLDQSLFDQLNSQQYHTVYPPIAQFTFAISAWLSPESWWGSSVIMKLFLFGFETGTILLLPRLLEKINLSGKNAILYALNPLVIVEVMGNLHFEGAMVFFLLLSIYLLIERKTTFSAVMMAFSIASKLLPLLFLMFYIKRLGWKRAIYYFGIIGVTLLVLFAPLLNGVFFGNFGQSLDLYFQKFEFNASIYYLARTIGYYISGYNLIAYLGPILASITFFGILITAIRERDNSWEGLIHKMLFAICLYLALTPTVHPWYVILPLALSLFTRFRFVVFWSGLISLTYINYTYDPYFENLWIVAVEYLAVFFIAAYEWLRSKKLPLGS